MSLEFSKSLQLKQEIPLHLPDPETWRLPDESLFFLVVGSLDFFHIYGQTLYSDQGQPSSQLLQ